MTIDAKYGIQIHEGMIARHRPAFKFGYNAAVGTDEETVWSQGGIYSYLSSASVLKVSSSNDSDTSTLTIEGLDANYDEISESVTITGQTAVNTTNSFLRVNRMFVTADEPTGDIYAGTGTVSSGVPANKYGKIDAGENQTLQAVVSIPRNHSAYIFNFTISSAQRRQTNLQQVDWFAETLAAFSAHIQKQLCIIILLNTFWVFL